MAYLNQYYLRPFRASLKKWKLLMFSILVELTFIIVFYFTGKTLFSNMMEKLYMLSDNNLTDKFTFLANVADYNLELKAFLLSFYLGGLIFLVIFLILYSLSRTLIWNKVLGTKGNFLRNFKVDLTLYIIFVALAAFMIQYIKQELYFWYFIFLLLPLMYISFVSHLNYRSKGYKNVFRSVFSIQLLLLLPHTLIIFLLSFVILRTPLVIIVYFILLNFFRIFSAELFLGNKQ